MSFFYTASNKLTHVSDAITNNTDAGDFRDRNTATNDYEYWPNGDLKKDLNKDITLIDYNFLRLPKELTLTSSRWLKYHYTASGQKLRKQNSTGEVWDYVGEFVYKNSSIYQITHEEGRITNGKYEYSYTDHLGNLRLSFRDSLTAGAPPVITQENHYSPFGLSLKGVDFQNTAPDNFKYSQNEQQTDFGVNLYDFGARFSDPTTGNRFLQIDPLAEISRRFSPYIYANSNPLRFIDPDGMSSQNIQDFDGNWHIVNKDEVNNLYTAPEEGDGDEKEKQGYYPSGAMRPASQQNATIKPTEPKKFGSNFSPEEKAGHEGVYVGAEIIVGDGILGLLGRGLEGILSLFRATRTSSNIIRTGTIWDDIMATQENYSGSVLPKSFELSTSNGNKVWVHGNATEHIAEFLQMKAVNSPPNVVKLTTQQMLRSLQGSVNQATKNGVVYNQMLNVGGWELKFAAPRINGQLPALIHALPK